MLARRLDMAFRKRAEHERTKERVRASQQPDSDPYPDDPRLSSLQIMEQTPPDQLTWGQLGGHTNVESTRCAAKWHELKALARADLAAGGRQVELLGKDTPWERARYLAVRDAFIDEWRPRGGMELALIEQAAYAHYAWQEWEGRANRLALEADGEERPLQRILAQAMEEGLLEGRPGMEGRYGLPRFEAMRRKEGEAARMADRHQRSFMRAVRGMRDLRRYAGAIHIHNEGQVNIGQQQVNVKE